jgi:ubiquinone/menaquinone biosynthesis C-methylase UbiE
VPAVKDPEGAELRALDELVDFADRRVLEVGCGDGRLTWSYARKASRVLGIDTEADAIAEARRATPPDLEHRVRFRVAQAEKLRVRPAGFDIAFLAWSL